jgi:hypothetical protein
MIQLLQKLGISTVARQRINYGGGKAKCSLHLEETSLLSKMALLCLLRSVLRLKANYQQFMSLVDLVVTITERRPHSKLLA